MPVLTTSTAPNSASCGGPITRTTANSTPRIALNLVSTLARRIWDRLRPGAGGTVLTCPASVLARTASSVRPVTAASAGAVMAGSRSPLRARGQPHRHDDQEGRRHAGQDPGRQQL